MPEREEVPMNGQYSREAVWRYESRKGGVARESDLYLYWECSGDPISDDFAPEEISAAELFRRWREWLEDGDNWAEALGKPWVSILWVVAADKGSMGVEFAPFGNPPSSAPADENFLTFYTWPTSLGTGERLNWNRLRVVDKAWRPGRGDKGGFIQEVTGWKPSAFQAFVNLDDLMLAVGEE
jgi:hypothetical protein